MNNITNVNLIVALCKNNGIGLAAPQVGLDKSFFIMGDKTRYKLVVNPKIVEKSKEQFVFLEGCLSFPNNSIKTVRYKSVTVEADNYTGKLHFGVWNENNEDGYNKHDKLNYALETACVQHEIDHLDGITMFDRQFKGTTLKRIKPWMWRRNIKASLGKQ